MKKKFDNYTEKRQIINALFVPGILGLFMILSFVFAEGMGWNFHTAGVFPRRIDNIWGIFTMIFVHAGWSHLGNNVVSFVILGTLLFLFYNKIAIRVLTISYLNSGLILWFIGRDSWHIGASGLIYSLAFFLFFSGILRKYAPLIAISLVVVFIYGSMVWHIFPWQQEDPISWEGHLAGCVTGTILSVIYRNHEPQKPAEITDDEDDSTEYNKEESIEDVEKF